MIGYLHFGSGNEPRQTVEVECRQELLPWQAKGYQFNATGYGPRIPSSYKVRWNNRWYRVYIANYGNSGSAYIGPRNNWLATFDNA